MLNLQEVIRTRRREKPTGLPVIHDRAAGIDIGARWASSGCKSPCSCTAFDPHGRMVRVNDKFSEVSGFSQQEMTRSNRHMDDAHANCNAYQGYLLSRPLPIEDFEVFCEKRSMATMA